MQEHVNSKNNNQLAVMEMAMHGDSNTKQQHNMKQQQPSNSKTKLQQNQATAKPSHITEQEQDQVTAIPSSGVTNVTAVEPQDQQFRIDCNSIVVMSWEQHWKQLLLLASGDGDGNSQLDGKATPTASDSKQHNHKPSDAGLTTTAMQYM